MAAARGNYKDVLITQRYLNTATYAGDPAPGTLVQTSDVSGSIVQSYDGMKGAIMTFSGMEAANYSDPNYATLYGGEFQYVRFTPATGPAVQGQVVFWKDSTTNLLTGYRDVTSDESAAELGEIAGIALANTAKNKYWWIQISGVAQVKFAGANNAATPAVGDLVFADYAAGSIYAIDPTQSTTGLTLAQLKAWLGTAFATAPANSSISPVLLGGPGPKYYPGT
jgi:hypothetical protein